MISNQTLALGKCAHADKCWIKIIYTSNGWNKCAQLVCMHVHLSNANICKFDQFFNQLIVYNLDLEPGHIVYPGGESDMRAYTCATNKNA